MYSERTVSPLLCAILLKADIEDFRWSTVTWILTPQSKNKLKLQNYITVI